MPSISKTNAAYMAGLMDGEGHFSIACGGNKNTATKIRVRRLASGEQVRTPSIQKPFKNYCVRIGCANTDKRLLNWVLQHIGGTYFIHRHKTANWKVCYKWTLYGMGAQEQFILAVLPYLILKRKQANILLQFIRLDGIDNPSKREELCRKVKLLNKRGAPLSPEANTSNTSEDVKIESVLHGDAQSEPQVTAVSRTN